MVEAMGVEECTVSAAHVGHIPSGPAVEAKQSADLGTGDEELLAALRLCEMVEAMVVEERTVSAAHVGRIPSGPAVEAKQTADLGTGDEELLAALRLCEMWNHEDWPGVYFIECTPVESSMQGGAGIIPIITSTNESNKAFEVESLAREVEGIRTNCQMHWPVFLLR